MLVSGTAMAYPYAYARAHQSATSRQHDCRRTAIKSVLDHSDTTPSFTASTVDQMVIAELNCSPFIYDFNQDIPQRYSTVDHYLWGRRYWPKPIDCPDNQRSTLENIQRFFRPISLNQVEPGYCRVDRTVMSSRLNDPHYLGSGGHMGYWVMGYQTTSNVALGITLESDQDISIEAKDFMGIDGFGLRARTVPWINDLSSQPDVFAVDEHKCRVHFFQKQSLFQDCPGKSLASCSVGKLRPSA